MVDPVRVNQAEEEADEGSGDTSDPTEVNKRRKKSARTRADRLEFVQAAMTTPQGRAWFYDTLLFCKIFASPFVSGDSHDTAFNCGMQNIGLRILDDLQTAAPTDYLTMVHENKTKNHG